MNRLSKSRRNALKHFSDVNIDSSQLLYILIDEITSIKDWNLELKYLQDSGIAKNAVILTTGSNASALRKEGELLPGRGIEGNEYFVKPLFYCEFPSLFAEQNL